MKKHTVHTRFLLFIFHFSLFSFFSFAAHSQYYTAMGLAPGNPGGINKDSDYIFALNGPPAGSDTVYNYDNASQFNLQYSGAQAIPFSFNFNGGPVTQFYVSTSGYITFAHVSGTPAGSSPSALPSSQLPDSTVCIWGLAGSAGGGIIYTKVFGTAPNQQLWITWWLAGNPDNANSVNIWSIVLEQTSNNIYLVDQWGDIAYSGNYDKFPVSLGLQLNATKAWTIPNRSVVNAHTWTPANTDNIYYEFSPDSANAYTPQIKLPMVEEFMQASCGPCFEAAPNVDTVMKKNGELCNVARYHVDWPGVDYIDNETWTPFVETRVSLYMGSNWDVPDAELDGIAQLYPGRGNFNSLTSQIVQDEEAIGSPFQLTLKDSFDVQTDTYYAIGSAKAFHSFNAGLKVMAILTVDTVEYNFDQSTENPGNNSTYLLNFPQTAEDIMPSVSGSALKAFTVGQSQNISLSWKKNHAWGAYTTKNCYCYDSTNVHITMFVYNSSTHYIYQSVSAAPGHTVVTAVSNSTSDIQHSTVELYPNPAGNYANVAFTLTEPTTVTLEVINLLGQDVMPLQACSTLQAGSHLLAINTGALQAGMYLVKLSTGSNVEIKKLIIQR